jgi:hypothetical protein
MEALFVEPSLLRQRLERYMSVDQITEHGERGFSVSFHERGNGYRKERDGELTIGSQTFDNGLSIFSGHRNAHVEVFRLK